MTYIFTSFIDVKENINDLYINQLIPFWIKMNSRFSNNLCIITNNTQAFSKYNINAINIDINDAFFNYPHNNLNPMSSQPACWKKFLETIKDNDLAIYLDPDAFLLNDNLIKYSKLVIDHKLTKKTQPYGSSDAGVSIIRKTKKTINMLEEISPLLSNKFIRCNIEQYYNSKYKGIQEYFISWNKITTYLRSTICGNSPIVDCIHGIDEKHQCDNLILKCANHNKTSRVDGITLEELLEFSNIVKMKQAIRNY